MPAGGGQASCVGEGKRQHRGGNRPIEALQGWPGQEWRCRKPQLTPPPRRKLPTTSGLEELNTEIKRHPRVATLFPNCHPTNDRPSAVERSIDNPFESDRAPPRLMRRVQFPEELVMVRAGADRREAA